VICVAALATAMSFTKAGNRNLPEKNQQTESQMLACLLKTQSLQVLAGMFPHVRLNHHDYLKKSL
jgi:hypothetical protein